VWKLWESEGEKELVSNYNPNVVCDHCQLKGHYKKDCYKLVGYPPGHPKYNDQKSFENRGQEYYRNYDRRNKQRRKESSAHNVVAEEWSPHT
ncbi:hypothetical protein HAX54_049720, partial [Datura stramonium]|nr:hypothetical protein [Datura stramonium]